jgi:hypothetical protein
MRPLRFIPENSLVEVTTRTIQGRLLLRPAFVEAGVGLGHAGVEVGRGPSRLFELARGERVEEERAGAGQQGLFSR